MLEMASLGSKVLQIRSVEFAGKYKVKLRVLSAFEDPESSGPGTLITFEEDDTMEELGQDLVEDFGYIHLETATF
jgi:aspartate kinase